MLSGFDAHQACATRQIDRIDIAFITLSLYRAVKLCWAIAQVWN